MARRARAREDAQASPRAPRRISDAGDARDARPHVERGDSRASPRFRERHRVTAEKDRDLSSEVSVSIDEDASVWRVSGPKSPPVRLLTSYDEVVRAIVAEMDRTAAGDRVEFSVYVMEPGASTDAVLRAMRRAATRGVRVDCSLDCSVVSAFTSWCEGTTTQAARLKALAAEFPLVTFSPRTVPTHAKYVVFHRRSQTPTAVFGGVNIGDRFEAWRDFAIRAEGRAAVGALAMCVNGEAKPSVDVARGLTSPKTTRKSSSTPFSSLSRERERRDAGRRYKKPAPALFTVGSRDRNKRRDAEARSNGVGFVANTPTGFDIVASALPQLRRFPGTFDVLPALRRLLGDERYDEYVVACAYLDTAGAAVLRLALDRGARVALVMPRTPNVYRDANAKALKRLMDEHGNFCDVSESATYRPGAFDATRRDETDFFSRLFYDESGGTLNLEPGGFREEPRGGLTAFVCDDMLHAKVFLARARDKSVPSACMIGSCNLKQRSFGQFAELNALITQPSLAKQLERELTFVASQSERVCSRDADALRYAEPRATIEEWLG
jgi:phosphatidylserine/phosphatidylglycerophosphate/cardiolipin synthase-like enzyme